MRRALTAVAVLAAVTLAWTLFRPAAGGPDVLGPQTADAGGVQVTVTPVQLDGTAALFDIAFDTHTVDLDLDPSTDVVLLVGSTRWGPPRWDGDPGGGHHRSGRLAFPAQGPASGAVQLSISGLAAPLSFTWDPEGT